MAKKKGSKYECRECGLVVVVDEPCGCAACELVCCEVPMKEMKPEKRKRPPHKDTVSVELAEDEYEEHWIIACWERMLYLFVSANLDGRLWKSTLVIHASKERLCTASTAIIIS